MFDREQEIESSLKGRKMEGGPDQDVVKEMVSHEEEELEKIKSEIERSDASSRFKRASRLMSFVFATAAALGYASRPQGLEVQKVDVFEREAFSELEVSAEVPAEVREAGLHEILDEVAEDIKNFRDAFGKNPAFENWWEYTGIANDLRHLRGWTEGYMETPSSEELERWKKRWEEGEKRRETSTRDFGRLSLGSEEREGYPFLFPDRKVAVMNDWEEALSLSSKERIDFLSEVLGQYREEGRFSNSDLEKAEEFWKNRENDLAEKHDLDMGDVSYNALREYWCRLVEAYRNNPESLEDSHPKEFKMVEKWLEKINSK